VLFYLCLQKKDKLVKTVCGEALYAELIPTARRGQAEAESSAAARGAVPADSALMQPRWGFQWEDITRKGIDVIVAIDVSQSMLAEDIKTQSPGARQAQGV